MLKAHLEEVIIQSQPDIVFHLAAQPSSKKELSNPILTWETNPNGTLNLLEALKKIKKCSTVLITTDKVYENKGWIYGYREIFDQLGGNDPYSASKAATEILIKSWQKFLSMTIMIILIFLKLPLLELAMLLVEVIGQNIE